MLVRHNVQTRRDAGLNSHRNRSPFQLLDLAQVALYSEEDAPSRTLTVLSVLAGDTEDYAYFSRGPCMRPRVKLFSRRSDRGARCVLAAPH